MSCAQCRGIEEQFDSRFVKLERWKHRRFGPAATTEALIEMILKEDVVRLSLLDIGGGLGAIQKALAKNGVSRIDVVDAASAYLDAARRLAAEEGYAERTEFHEGDFVEVAGTVERADIVTLDRVICCYDDVKSLLTVSASKCRTYYGVVYPRSRRLLSGIRLAINGVSALRGSPYRFFVHDEELVRNTLAAAGLRLHRSRQTVMWNVEIYRR